MQTDLEQRLTDRQESLVSALVSPQLAPLFLRAQRTGIESAWFGHVPFAHWIIAACQPRMLVELGTHNGASYSAFCEAILRFGTDCRAFAVDTWQGDAHTGSYGDAVYWDLRRFHDERFGGFSELLRCTFDEARAYFANGSVDLLHIDGLHTYDAVRADWEDWRPKLSEQAVVLLHDTNVRERDFGVWQLWAELQAEYPGFEFLHGHGLGVLAVGPRASKAVRALCELSSARDIATVRERFALLGERWVEGNEGQSNLLLRQQAEASLAGARQELARTDAEFPRLSREARTAQAERDAARADLAREWKTREQAELEARGLRQRTASAEAEQDRMRAGLADLARITAERDRLRDEVGALALAQAQLVDLRRHYHAVLTSASWRATAPLRQVGGRFPATARHVRRAGKLGMLTATGRLPGRMRLRRQLRLDAETIGASVLFNRAGYLSRYSNVAQAGTDPLWHYIWNGAAAGYDPHPLFESRWYLAQHPEVAAAGINPFAHYLREGAALGFDPHSLFDTAYYVQQAPEAAGANMLLHYSERGAAGGLDPNGWFDTDAYWEEYLRGRDNSLDPLSHYVLHGAAAGLDPHPLFDTDYYVANYPDSAGWNPLAHYLREGLLRGYSPCLLLAQCAEQPPSLRFTPRVAPDVSIIVPAYGRLFDTIRCLTSIMMHSGNEVAYEVIVIDDRPEAPIAHRLRSIPGLRVEQNPRNLGFLLSCNRAADLAAGRYLLLLNNDTSVHPDWLAPLVQVAERDKRVGIVGAMLLNADGTLQEAGGTMGSDGWGRPYGRGANPDQPDYNFVREVDVVVGACLLVRVAAWEQAGGFDERYAPAYYEEFDLAFALRDRGWTVLYQPASRVTHYDASSYGTEERDRRSVVNHDKFCRKWARALESQPKPDAPVYIARERPLPAGRILVVDDRVPEPDKHAGSVSTFDWLRLMREAGLRVTYAPHDAERPEPYTTALHQLGIEVLVGDVDRAAWIAENGQWLDWVWVARPDVAAPLLETIEQHAPGKLIYFTHDLHFLREQRRFELTGDVRSLEESRRLRRLERRIFSRARLVITPSAEEVREVRELAPQTQVRAVPLYSVPSPPLAAPLDPKEFEARSVVLFVGGYAHPPNVDGALFLAREVMPLVWQQAPEARLVLAGNKPTPELLALVDERTEVPGWLPDLAPIYGRARLSVTPLRYGAGVKGKIIASLQAGVPVVTTSIGNEGLGLRDGIEALVADTPQALASAVLALLRDPTSCARLAAAGSAVLRRHFGEDVARRALMDVLGRDTCPVCGRRTEAAQPLRACDTCGATAGERALAEAVIRPYRGLRISSVREAAPMFATALVRMPPGPLNAALGRATRGRGALDLLVASDGGCGGSVRPGGRWIFPASEVPEKAVAEMAKTGWEVRLHEAGPAVVEARKLDAVLAHP